MFKADILNMAGGKETDVDVRDTLSVCAETMSKNPETLYLCASPCIPKYDNRRIPLIIPAGTSLPSSQEELSTFDYFSTHRLENEKNPLVEQLGHLNVRDAAADGNLNTTNLLYAGSSVVEYDLVEYDVHGKRYMYSEPSVLEKVLAAKTDNRYKAKEVAPKMGHTFIDKLIESSYETINNLIEMEGPYVSSGKLLTDIMVIMRLFEEETRRVESTCVDPVFRNILAECYGSEEKAPLFSVAFVTNAALMGLKVVFYPTALEWKTGVKERDCMKLKSLLKIQMNVMAQSMPVIVEKIEEVKTRYTFCFSVDIRGSSNWNLPGHCKNDPQSFPYHFARLIGDDKNVLEISNKKMVTSLGVVDCIHAKEWMYNFLGEFEQRSTYAENILGATATASNGSEWRRRVLFSDIGSELPFRKKSITMDLDFCLSGMCYHYIASGQGILLSKRRTNKGARTKIFSCEKVGEIINESDGAEEKKTQRPTAPPVPLNIPASVTSAYDNTIKKSLGDVLKMCDGLGMFLGKENVAPGLAMRILSASKAAEKKDCMESLTDDAACNLKWLSRSDKLNHNTLLQFALLQLVLRYECRNMVLPRDNALLSSIMALKSWSQIDLENVWKFAHEETLKPPTETPLPVPSSESDQQNDAPVECQEKEECSTIKKMLMATASTFASGADKEDTMFSWLMVTLAERFCALYNIVSHPEEYYSSQQGHLSFEGGLSELKKMCEILLPELEVYIPKNTFKVCRKAVKGYESAVTRNKNATNNMVCKVKLAELKMMHGLNTKTRAVNHNEISTVTGVGSRTFEAFQSLFDPIEEEWITHNNGSVEEPMECDDLCPPRDFEDERLQDEFVQAIDDDRREEEEEKDAERGEVSAAMADFFNCVNNNRSFIFRASLCHRQKYVSVEVVRALETELGRLLTLKKHSNSNSQTLKEIRERSERMRDWVVPFTMPSNTIDIFFSKQDSAKSPPGGCNCFHIYSGGNGKEEGGCKKCIKLLVIPPSAHLKSLITALKFNTMASERRYFSDVSEALGFKVSSKKIKNSILSEKRWNSFSKYKCCGEFLAKISTSGLYENVIEADNKTISAFKPRTASRKRSAELNNKRNSGRHLNKHTGFFSGVWALCADHDLETTVLGSTVSSPFSPTPLFRMTSGELADTEARINSAANARKYFELNSSLSFFKCFQQMRECMAKTNLDSSNPVATASFFSDLIKKYGRKNIPGANLWTLFSAASECFKNSLPVDWISMITNWTSDVLNLTPGVNNIDESGAVFETSRFLSVCARSFFGSCLNVPLGVKVWRNLLAEQSWLGELSRAYEVAMEDTDVRVVENFINSSNFMTNNNIIDKLKIVPTKNESVLHSVWKEKNAGESLNQRAEWLASTEEYASFSLILAAFSLFRVMLNGEDVKRLGESQSMRGADEQTLVPFIRGLKITGSWCKTFVTDNNVYCNALKCISEMRFVNIQKDPIFFYRFAGYIIGLIASNDMTLENITRKILDSFDFNGFDTSNWTRFIRFHFPSILLGRRARLLSRPMAFIKNLLGLALAPSNNFAKSTGIEGYEKRVCRVLSRLAKLILVKTVNSEIISTNDLLDCCILNDKDVTMSSISGLYNTVRSEFTSEKPDYGYILASNSCTNSQLAKIKCASRLLSCNVSFYDTSDVTSAIDVDEESIIDPSMDIAMSASDAAEFRRKPDDDGDSRRNFQSTAENDSGGKRSKQSCEVLNFDEETIDEDTEPPKLLSTASKSSEILKRVSKMLTQKDINTNTVQTILKMKTFLTVKIPFNESDSKKLGLQPWALKAGIEAIKKWGEAVEEESSKIIDECEKLQIIGGEYDMSVIDPKDYAKSKNKNCTYRASPSFNKTLLMSSTVDKSGNVKDDDFNWLNFQKQSEKLSKHDIYNCGGGRLTGYAAKDMIDFGGEGTAEIRVITKLFSNKINDSYWLDVMPPNEEGATKKNNRNKWSTEKTESYCNNVLKLKVNGKVKESKSIVHCCTLMSLYRVTDPTEGEEDDNLTTFKSPKDIYLILGDNAEKPERYKCLRSLWNCNNGISPRNQIELLKKLLFKDTNVLWIKQYDRHINVLNTWGCLNVNNAYDSHFSLCHDYVYEEVQDVVPPMSVFHSRFFDDAECEYLSKTIVPLLALKKKLNDNDNNSTTESSLLSGLYSREILSSSLDPGGKFCTSYFTNSCSVLFTPGTDIRLRFDQVSSMDTSNHIYLDEELAGKERELNTRSFLAFTLEILEAIERGVFFEGEKTYIEKMSRPPPVGRVLRPVDVSKANIDEQSHGGNIDSKKCTQAVFETPETNYVISETNNCILMNCDNAKCLLMSQRAMLNTTTGKRYDGSVFNSYSMRYHAGISKGYLLDDKLDLFSMHDRTFTVNRKSECDICVFNICANHFILPDSEKELRIFTNDWHMIKSLVQLNTASDVYDTTVKVTLMPCGVPIGRRKHSNPLLEKSVAPYNLRAIKGGAVKYNSACFLANPCGPARRLLKRAPNMRICVTNAGIAQVSRRLAESDKVKTVENLIKDGMIASFKVASGSSCISVDSSRYFLIDGSYLLGGRIEEVNLQTDMFTRCKLKAEKHAVYTSLFSPRTVSAFLATAIEGTTHSLGLGLLEHVSSMKNNEVANRCNKSFWSRGDVKAEDGDKVPAESNDDNYLAGTILKPPSVYTNDEDYVFLRMLFEIAKGAKSNNDQNQIKSTTCTNVTETALNAIIKCYTDCVNQKTGAPNLHSVHFLRSLLNFGGFCTAVCTGDGEKSHHLIYTLNSVALNMATKAIVALVGPSGNNLKTTIVEVLKKAWFEKYADVSVGVLNSSKDSASSTQANLAYYAGNKNILIIDEVGYQGSTNIDSKTADVQLSFSASDDAAAVWNQIDCAMTESKLKICSKESKDIRIKKRKREGPQPQQNDSDAMPMIASTWLMKRTVSVRAFANSVLWWNCVSGTVRHKFNDIRTCYNMLSVDRFPFSVSNFHFSPWLTETDAIWRHCTSKLPRTSCEIKEALHCLVGNLADDYAVTDSSPIVDSSDRGLPEEKISGWKLNLKLITKFSSKVEKVFNDLVKGNALLRWTTMNSIRHGDQRPVLTCVATSKECIELLLASSTVNKEALSERLLNPSPYEFSESGGKSNFVADGVLYAFHAIHSGDCEKDLPSAKEEISSDNSSTTNDDDAEALGPLLSNISYSAIKKHRAKSQKLSSIIFSGGANISDCEIDQDSYINMEREYDYALFNLMENPLCKSLPKFTTDGVTVMKTQPEDCKSVLNHIKKTIADSSKLSNPGSFIRLCLEKGLLDEDNDQQGPNCSLFGLSFENNNSLKPRCRNTLASLIKFRSDGKTIPASDIAKLVSFKNEANSVIAKQMLPGQFNSNLLKKITTKQASAAMRGIFCKPVVSSISMTPIMTSNSYIFSFFVDEALAKRMIIFPFNTQFNFGSVNEKVDIFVDLLESGLKCVHSALTLERQEQCENVPPEKEVEENAAVGRKWLSRFNKCLWRAGEIEFVSNIFSVAAMLPSLALQLLLKNSALEHRDMTSMVKLEESANTFMHTYTTFTLSSKSETTRNEKQKKQKIEQPLIVVQHPKSLRKKAMQMCQINPKSLNTMAAVISKSRQIAWGNINAAMNCVLFIETPFVHTSRLFGEDCNLKMFIPKKENLNPNINLDWCIGLRMPNPDMNVNGYSKEGPMIGAGAAIMKQLCDAWGSTDLRNIMYSCHQLHMIFELVFQFSQPKRKLTSIDSIRPKNKAGVDYVSVIFACLIYKEMMSKLRYPVFIDNNISNKKQKTERIQPYPFEIPMFVSMVINKPLAALRSTTNFSSLSDVRAQQHAELIKYITAQLGQTLNVDFLCPTCK